jgi:HEAT repeat protein
MNLPEDDTDPDSESWGNDQADLYVSVCTLAGDVLELTLHPKSPVLALKRAICEHWGWVLLSMDLVQGTALLENGQLLEAYAADGEPLQVTCIKSNSILNSSEAHVRVTGVRQLLQVAHMPGTQREDIEEIVNILKPCLADPIEEVRRSTVEALGDLGNQGDESIISLLKETLTIEKSDDVRCSVVEAFGKLAPRSHDADLLGTLMQVHASARPRDKDLRRSLVEAVAKVARPGNQPAIAYVVRRLGDGSKSVRRTAVEGLAELALVGNAQVINLLIGVLEDWDADVKEAAVQALSQVALFGHPAAIAALSACFTDKSGLIRRGAANALQLMTPRGTEVVVAALRRCLECEGPIQEDAVLAWEKLA